MTNMARLIELQDAARNARRIFLGSCTALPPVTSLKAMKRAEREYEDYLFTYMDEHRVSKEVYAQIEAARAAQV